MTISAYQGVGSIAAPMALALENDKGLFVLAATSNVESFTTQTAVVNRGKGVGRSVAASIVDEVKRSNAAPLGSCGVVIGATVRLSDFGLLPSDLAATPVLSPGFGFQGAAFDAIPTLFGDAAANVVVSSSRAILEEGPDGIRSAIEQHTSRLAEVFAV